MSKTSVTYEIGITKMSLKDRVIIAFRLIFKKPVVLDCGKANIYHTNRNSHVSHIEL